MKCKRSGVFILFILLAGTAVTHGQRDDKEGSQFRITVIDKNGNPVSDAKVTLTKLGNDGPKTVAGFTDREGIVLLRTAAFFRGTFGIEVIKMGYETKSSRYT